MLDSVKRTLRIIGNDFDVDILELIEEAKADLKLSGVNNIADTDPLIKRAIKVFCKWNYDIDNQEAERYQESYESLKQHLSLSVEYTEVTE